MNYDAILRAAAVVAAAALLASPSWGTVVRVVAQAAKAAKAFRPSIARGAAVVLLIFAVFGPGALATLRIGELTVLSVVTAAKVVVGLLLIAGSLIEAGKYCQLSFATHRTPEAP